jgi:hypothetical protein
MKEAGSGASNSRKPPVARIVDATRLMLESRDGVLVKLIDEMNAVLRGLGASLSLSAARRLSLLARPAQEGKTAPLNLKP